MSDSQDRFPNVRPNDINGIILDSVRAMARKVDALDSKMTSLGAWFEAHNESRARDREDVEKLELRIKALEAESSLKAVVITELRTKMGLWGVLAPAVISTAAALISHAIK